MIPSKIYPLTIPANGSFELMAIGDMFKVLTSSGTFNVRGDSFGDLGALLPGQGLDETPFKRLLFTDTSGNANTLQVLTADGRFIDDRITGEVSVIDGGKVRTIAGGILGAGVLCPSGAGSAVVQLWNPLGTGKRLVVPDLSFGSPTAVVSLFVGLHNANIGGTNVTATQAQSFLGGGAVGSAQAWYNAAGASPLVARTWAGVASAGLIIQHRPLGGPYVVPPGYGLIAATGTGAVDFYASFSWYEEVIV